MNRNYDELSSKAFELVEQGVEVFNEWRLQNITPRIDFSKRSFSGGKYNEYIFVNADFSNANFEDAQLDNTLFSASNLEGVDFSGVKACKAIFGTPELINAELDADFQKYLSQPSNLQGACFMGADLTSAIFRGANIKDVNFVGSFLEYADFRATNFQEADFEDARLGKTLFPTD